MSNSIQLFDNPNFGKIRTTTTDTGEPLFCAKDVAITLGYTNPAEAIRTHCRAKGVREILTPSDGGTQSTKFITEDNLYRLVMRSKLPTAEKFQDWVTEEILPTIRKTGAYATPTTIDSIIANPENGIKLLTALIEERALREQAQAEIAAKQALITQRDAKIEADRPKVEFADAVQKAEGEHSMSEVAKLLAGNGVKNAKGNTIGRNSLFKELRTRKILMSNNEPYQPYIAKGYFTVKTDVIDRPCVSFTKPQTFVTQSGLDFLIRLFLGKNKLINTLTTGEGIPASPGNPDCCQLIDTHAVSNSAGVEISKLGNTAIIDQLN